MIGRLLGGLAAASLAATAAAQTSGATVALTVEEAVARAREASPTLVALGEREAAAGEAQRGANAERLPRIDARAGYTRWSDVPEFSTFDPTTGEETVIFPNLPDNFLARVDLRAPLYVGGRTASLERAATEQVEAVRRERDAAVHDVRFETERAYWNLALTRDSSRVLGESLAAYEAHLADARNFERVGMAPRSEVLRVEVERDRAELERIRAESAARIAQADLARLVDVALGTTITTVDPIDAPAEPAEPLDALLAEAAAHRPEREALAARARALEASAEAERAAARPHASLAAGYEYADPQRRIVPPESGWNDAWDVGVALTMRLWDGGRTKAAAARVTHETAAVRAQLDELDRRIGLEVLARREELLAASAAVEVADRGVASAREAVRVAGERYRAGVLPSSELLDAETALLIAGLDRVRAWAEVRIARAALDRAVGRVSETP